MIITKYYADNIKWDVFESDVLDCLNDMTPEEIIEEIGIDEELLSNLCLTDPNDLSCVADLMSDEQIYNLLDLPTQVEIPIEELDDDEKIMEFLEDMYGFGFTVHSFELKEIME